MSRPTASFCLHFRGIAQFTKPSRAGLGGWLSQFDYKQKRKTIWFTDFSKVWNSTSLITYMYSTWNLHTLDPWGLIAQEGGSH